VTSSGTGVELLAESKEDKPALTTAAAAAAAVTDVDVEDGVGAEDVAVVVE